MILNSIQHSYMKNSCPCLFLLALCFSFTGCDRPSSNRGSSGSYDAAAYAEWEAQQERARQQMNLADEHMKEQGRQITFASEQMTRITALYDKQEGQINRLDKLLDKWEEQAKRKDAILDKMEQEHGIKK
jgi:hypothetical protein